MNAVINWTELDGHIGDEQLIEEIISIFLADNAERMELLTVAVRAANIKDTRSLSHAMKGSAAVVTAKPLSQAAHRLELAARETNLGSAESLLADVEAEFDRLKRLLSDPNWIQIAKEKTKNAGV